MITNPDENDFKAVIAVAVVIVIWAVALWRLM